MRWNPFRRSKAATPVTGKKSASFLMGLGFSRSKLTNATYQALADEGYSTNAVANACINKVANSVASINRKLYKKGSDGKLEEIKQHPLLDLLNRPNPTQSGDEFTRALVSYYLIAGNSYLFGNGIDPKQTKPKPPTEIQLLNPGKVKVEPGDSLFPKYFEYKPTPSKVIQYPVEQVNGRSAILHLKTFNPLNDWYGLSPMLAAAYGIDINNAGQLWNKRLLDNDCRPSGALVVKNAEGKTQELTDDQYNRLKEQIDDHFSGAINAGKPLLLEGGLEWQQLSMNAKDIDFSKGKDSSARDICMIFGVPPQLVGIPGSQTFANYEQAVLSFWTETVIPLHDWIQDAYNRWLVPLYGDDLVLSYDVDSIDALEPMRKQKFDRLKNVNFLTLNEFRKAVGKHDLPGKVGDVIVISGRGGMLDTATGEFIPFQGTPTAADNVNEKPDAKPAEPTEPNAATHKAWLIAKGYTPERAERLTKLVYG